VVGVALDRLHQRRQGVDRLHRIVLTTQHAVAETAGGIRRIDVAEVVQAYQALLFGISVLVGGCIQAVLDQDLAIGGACNRAGLRGVASFLVFASGIATSAFAMPFCVAS